MSCTHTSSGHEPVHASQAVLDKALRLLDAELGKIGETITIRAIGGYALMRHGITRAHRPFTVDIDTVTTDYSRAVIDTIARVGQEMRIDEDWVNNDNVGPSSEDEDSVALLEMQYDAKWAVQSDLELENIELFIADVPTLTRAKILAADAAELSGRSQDLPDLMSLLQAQSITTYGAFCAAYPDPFDETPDAHAAVRWAFSH